MVDEIFDRAYRDSRAELNASLAGAFAGIGHALGDSFKVLHRIEWSAPWEQNEARAHSLTPKERGSTHSRSPRSAGRTHPRSSPVHRFTLVMR